MKMLATRRVIVSSSAIAILLSLVIAYGLGKISAAGNQSDSVRAGDEESSATVFQDVVQDNVAKIRFVRGTTENGAREFQGKGMELSQMKPLSLASDDLNADGFPDLILGYETNRGGVVVIRYGRERAFAPSSPEDIQAVLENRFIDPFQGYSVIHLDRAPEFLFTGDFDRDSRRDILAAAGDDIELNFLLRDGDSFTTKSVTLPGQVASLAVSETFSPDGFADVYAGIVGGQLVAFEKTASVLEQKPDIYPLPGTPDAIALGRFDDGTSADFAVIVAGQVYVVHGGDHNLVERIDLPFTASSITAADFIWDKNSRMEIAVAAATGGTSILARGVLETTPLTADDLRSQRRQMEDIREGRLSPVRDGAKERSGAWRIAEQTSVGSRIASSRAPALIPMLASGQQSVDLLAVDGHDLGVSFRTDGPNATGRGVSREYVSLASSNEVVAVLPMRLNVHARPSLVVLRAGSPDPEFLFMAPSATFTVTKTADTNDGACNADCSLREAVGAANAAAGADTVAFSAALNGTPIQLTRVGDDNTNANGDLDVNSDITFLGNGTAATLLQGSSSATFTGNMGDKLIGVNQSGALTTQSVSLTNLTIRFTRNDITVNGNFTQTGGAMDIFLSGTGAMPGPTTSISSVIFESNANLHSRGGALNIDSAGTGTNIFRGTVQISGSAFSNNDTLTTTVAATDEPPRGGAINMFADRHNVTISSTNFSGNQTSNLDTATGGALNIRHSFGGTVTINSNTGFANNIAGSDGGAIFNAINQTLSITGGTMNGNSSVGTGDSAAGGGIYNLPNDTFSTTLSQVSITNNIATGGTAGTGGGIADASNAPLSINNCTITGNAADVGGGVAVVSSGGTQTATISNSTSISGNTATTGAAAYISAGVLALSNTNTISGNVDLVENATAALTTNAGSTTNLTGNLTMGNGTITGNNGIFNITGNYSQSGGTFNANTGNYTITGSFSQSGGTFFGNTSTFSVGGGSTISNGTFNGGGAFNVTGTHTVSGGIFNAGGTLTMTGAGNYTQSGGTFNGGSGSINLVGNFAFTGGTFNAGTSTFNFNGSGAQSISNTSTITFFNVSNANVTQPLTLNNTINANGTLTANGASTILNPAAAAVIGGTGTLTGTGTVRVTRASGSNDFLQQYTIANKTLTNLLVDYVGPGLQGISGTTYTNVRLNNGSGAILSAPATVNGTLTLAAGAFDVGTSTLTLNSVITSIGGTITSSPTGTVIYNQASNGQTILAGSYGNLTLSGFNKVLPAAGTIFIAGTFTPGAATGHTITGSTIEFSGSGAQTIPAFNYNNLVSSNAGARTLQNSGTIGIAGSFTPGTNPYTITGSTIDFNGSAAQTIPAFGYNNLTSSNAGTRTLASTGTIRVAGVFTPGTNAYTITGSTVEYNGTAAQTLPTAFTTYNNLTLNNPAGVTGFAGLTVQGLLRVQVGTFTSSSAYNNVQIDSGTTLAGTNGTTINVTGNWTNNGAFNANNNNVAFNGTSAQTIAGSSPTTFNNLVINNAAGVALTNSATVNGTLTLLSGEVSLGLNLLTLGNTATVSRTSGHVVGTVRKNFGGPGPAFEIPVGTPGAYSPLNVTVVAGTGHLTAIANTGIPGPPPMPLDPGKTLQRYWTLSGTGIRSNITFNYLNGDVLPPPNDENTWSIIRITGNTGTVYPDSLPYVTMDPANNRFTIEGLDSYSHWTAGEPIAPTAANADISGRVVDAAGRGIAGAQVLMHDPSGNVHRGMTNPFGYYVISSVPAGQSYLVSAAHRRYTFQSRTVRINEDLTDLDFVADVDASRTP